MKPKHFIVLIIVLMIIVIIAIPSRSEQVTQWKTVTVHEGDTLYSIVVENYPNAKDIRPIVYEIQKHNGLYGAKSWLQIGQDIEIPIKDNMR